MLILDSLQLRKSSLSMSEYLNRCEKNAYWWMHSNSICQHVQMMHPMEIPSFIISVRVRLLKYYNFQKRKRMAHPRCILLKTADYYSTVIIWFNGNLAFSLLPPDFVLKFKNINIFRKLINFSFRACLRT
jgi:hypothetical protein